MKNHEYKPVSCSLYDLLTDASVVNKELRLQLQTDNETKQEITTFVHDIITKNGEEFLLCSDGTLLRLDKIVSFTIA
jgi:transcriptional antiterminator Rof (Rho-off)